MIELSVKSRYTEITRNFNLMNSSSLTPLPFENSDEAMGYRRVVTEGFVDESVVLAVIAKGTYERIYVQHEAMVLSSSGDDYAGWALPVPSPFRDLLDVKTPAAPAEQRLPGAPETNASREFYEPGLADPHNGTHRWWLFGVSGAMTCGILSLTLLSLAQRGNVEQSMAGYMPSARIQATELAAEKPRLPEPALVNAAPVR
jgi:hypothetical protein